MKNTLMFLLASLLLAFNLTACGGDGQQAGANGSSGAAGQTDGITGDADAYSGTGSASGGITGDAGVNNGTGSTAGSGDATYRIDRGNSGDMSDNSLMDDARDVLDDAGNAVDRAADNF